MTSIDSLDNNSSSYVGKAFWKAQFKAKRQTSPSDSGRSSPVASSDTECSFPARSTAPATRFHPYSRTTSPTTDTSAPSSSTTAPVRRSTRVKAPPGQPKAHRNLELKRREFADAVDELRRALKPRLGAADYDLRIGDEGFEELKTYPEVAAACRLVNRLGEELDRLGEQVEKVSLDVESSAKTGSRRKPRASRSPSEELSE